MKTVKINGNIRLNYIPMTKLKTTSLGVYIHRPLNREQASFNALLPLVLKSASKKYPSREDIAKRLDNLYGATMGSTTMKFGEDHIIYFDAETISDKYAPNGEKLINELLELLMSVLFEPKTENGEFDIEITEQERKNAIDKIDAFINDKRSYASARCQQETARGTNFEIMSFGDKEALAKITAKELYSYYSSIIKSSIIDIYICGDADIISAEDTVRKYVNGMQFEQGEVQKTDIINRDNVEINDITEHMNVTQGKLAMSFLTNTSPDSDDRYALSVLNSVFGAGAHSKLFNNVREKLSLAYYASSQLEKFKGMMIVNAGIEFENFQKAKDEILVQLEEIKKGNISDFEFDASIKTIVNAYNSYYDDQRALVSLHLSNSVVGTNTEISEYIENISKVTKEDVVRVARKLQLDTVYFLAGKGEN
ncbi:MAG: pitrilysin family protein [Clostridia bacterium]|nr:pitrilysin family protein [Clostridia bacterium]